MKFDDKYKRVNYKWENGGIFKGLESCKCVICDEPTPWIEPVWDLNVCSDECYNIVWKKYFKYLKTGKID